MQVNTRLFLVYSRILYCEVQTVKQKPFTHAVLCVILFTKTSARGTTIKIQVNLG